MATANFDLYRDNETNELSSYVDENGNFIEQYGYVAKYDFFSGDTYSQQKNGFVWSGSKTIATPSGETEAGGRFTFLANADPRNQQNVEQRYSFTEMEEFWFKKRFFVPPNYFHTYFIVLTIVGDISTWVKGDALIANDGISTGLVDYISGQTVCVLFPQNGFDLNWNGNVTNTTRSQTRSATRGGWPDNNKFHAFWCDDYSFNGASPTVVFELRADRHGGSKIYYHFGADYQVVGTLPNSTSAEVEFIRVEDLGKWFDCVFHIKMATTETAEDGVIEFWVRREGEINYTKLFSQSNAKIGARAAASNAKFRNGYCHGYQNVGYYVETSLYDSQIILSRERINGVY